MPRWANQDAYHHRADAKCSTCAVQAERLVAAERLLRIIETGCANKPHAIKVASGEIQTVYDLDGGTMRELRAFRSSVSEEPTP